MRNNSIDQYSIPSIPLTDILYIVVGERAYVYVSMGRPSRDMMTVQ